jgi:uncharacterized OB-fold protein
VSQVPLVHYLSLDGERPVLVAQQCAGCGARFFDRRLACANCPSRKFVAVPLPITGRVGTFTIVHRAAPGVATPFVSAVIYLADSTAVKANIVDCPPTPEHVQLGMRVALRTFTAAVDADGTEAVAFGFAPAPADGAA